MPYRDEFKSVEREAYWSLPRIAVWFIAVALALGVVGFVGDSLNFWSFKFWAPKQEAVRRQVYEQSKAYRQGSVQRLNTLCGQVATADAYHKPMVNDIINQEFAEWNAADVPDYLQSCLATARNGRN